MNEMTINVLRDDIKFIEQGINKANNYKKAGSEKTEVKTTNRQKKLKYFLKKSREITLKSMPEFKRSKLNKSRLDMNGDQPCILWTVELVFNRKLSIIINDINEFQSIDGFCKRDFLKKDFHNEEFNDYITSSTEPFKKICIKK